jgi:hypothetical protein
MKTANPNATRHNFMQISRFEYNSDAADLVINRMTLARNGRAAQKLHDPFVSTDEDALFREP